MSDKNFWELSGLAYQHAGIVLGEHKKNLVYSRLSRRIRKLGLPTFGAYIELISDTNHSEFDEFLNTITTNLTSFFRESHHFDFLSKTIIPSWRSNSNTDRTIWSAGCSSGEEPYSIAMTLRENIPRISRVRVLATDLDANVLNHARSGEYDVSRIESLDNELLKKYFFNNEKDSQVKVKPTLQNLITFNRLNLLGQWPMKKQFDVIFCRNVLIYFDKETQKTLVERYVDKLKPKGYLIIGHSENITRLNDDLNFVGQTIYQKIN